MQLRFSTAAAALAATLCGAWPGAGSLWAQSAPGASQPAAPQPQDGARQPAAPQYGAPQDETPATPGYLGLVGDDDPAGGVWVLQVNPTGPAAAAGVAAGDVIVRLDGEAVNSVEAFAGQMRRRAPGARLRLEVVRNGLLLELTAQLTERPAAAAGPLERERDAARRAILGVLTSPAERVPALGDIGQGAIVERVFPRSPAAAAGVPLGAVIVGVDELPVDTPATLSAIVASREPGATIVLHYYEGLEKKQLSIPLAAPAGDDESDGPATPAGPAPPPQLPPPPAADSPLGDGRLQQQQQQQQQQPQQQQEQLLQQQLQKLQKLQAEVEVLRARVEQLERRLEAP